jgi:Domain of unknown function (DUF1772)
MAPAYDIIAATVTGMMVGNEFAIAAFVHPPLLGLGGLTHARIAAPLARTLGGAMPFWYGLALLLILGAAYEHRPISTGPGLLIAIAAAVWAATIVFTVATLVPINNRIARLNPEQPYPTWLHDRARWDRLHRIRVALLIIALLLLLTGLFGGITTPVS